MILIASQKDFLFYQQVLAQQPKDKNKIYSLHEPDVYVIAKGKDHKQYEYGNKVSVCAFYLVDNDCPS
jgi:IS5 family transposase